MLAESKDDDLLAFHSVRLFAGLCVAEIRALDWRDVDLAGGFIHVGTKISKTRSRRLVPILDNLKAWLQPIAKARGRAILTGLRRPIPIYACWREGEADDGYAAGGFDRRRRRRISLILG